MVDEEENIIQPPRRLKPLKMPRTAWGEDNSTSEGIQPSTSASVPQDVGAENFLSPPTHPIRIAQPGESASIERTPETSNVDEYRDVIEDASIDRIKSPTSSSISSKRTSLTAEFTSQIRQKIRQQAKSMVQKKRGSVQLAKRLLRSQTLNTGSETEIDLGDQEAIDKQIDETIKAGHRFSLSGKTIEAPPSIQKKFFEFKSTKKKIEDKPTNVVFSRPLARTQKDMDKFKSMIITYSQKRMDFQIEDPYTSNAGLFAAISGRDLSRFFQRQGDSYSTSIEAIKRINSIITHNPLRLDREIGEDIGLVEYQKAVNWKDWDIHTKRNIEYSTLSFDLNRIELDHHWLFTKEDKFSRKVITLHHELILLGSKILDINSEFESFKNVMNLKVLSESQKLESIKQIKEYKNSIENLKKEYMEIVDEVDKNYKSLKEIKELSKNASTKFVLKKLFITEIKEEWQELFQDIPLYFIEGRT